jgi:flagellar biosynthesis/type III secretory pathway M-ring protein FliF/YscJ
MTYVIVLVVLFLVVFVITAPLRRSDSDVARRETERELSSPEVLELEAAREAKYREIRDAELDHQTGKLSDDDYQAVDSNLRAEAIEILRRLDEVKSRP